MFVLIRSTSKKIFVMRLFISSLFCEVAVSPFSLSENLPATMPTRAVNVVVNLKKKVQLHKEYGTGKIKLTGLNYLPHLQYFGVPLQAKVHRLYGTVPQPWQLGAPEFQ